MDLSRDVVRILRDQHGVIARRQALGCGMTRSDVDRLIRRREWTRMLPGVYVDHTGPPTWLQRAWAGVLYYWPAALAGPSAMRAHAGQGWRRQDDRGPIVIAVAADRHVSARPGYRVRFLTNYDGQVLHHRHPPRMRVEDACLDLAIAAATAYERIQVLADACASRLTTARRLLQALSTRSRVPARRWLEAVLRDIEEGTSSVLEHGYLTLVERPHGLPRGRRQRRDLDSSGRVYRDVVYEYFDQFVELDGLLGHDTAADRDADMERDLDAAVTGRGTVRLGWGQVFGRSCRTAAKIGAVLANRGWSGVVLPCRPGCEAHE